MQQEHVVGGMWLVLLSCWALTVQGQVGSGSLENANWTNCGANSTIEMTFVPTAMTWNAAEQSCQRAQGHLAAVIMRNAQCATRAIMQGNSICETATEIHIGLRSFGNSTRYFWLGEVNSQFNQATSASERCGFWTINGSNNKTFGRGSCNVPERSFLCQRRKLFQVPQPDASQQCIGLNRTITYNTISFNLSDAAEKCLEQNGTLARVIGENKACLTALMMSLDSGAQLEQTRVACGNCSGGVDCVTEFRDAMLSSPSFGIIQDARPFLCETNMTSAPGVATTTMPGIGATTNMTSSPGVATTTPVAEASSSKSSNIGLYAGAGAGAVVLVLLIGIAALLLKRRQERRGKSSAGEQHNVHRGSESSGVGLLRQPESSRPTLSSPRYEQAPIPKATSLGAFANPTYTDVVKPAPKLPPPVYTVLDKEPTDTTQESNIYNVLHRNGHAGSGGSSQDAGATNTAPPPGGFYNKLEHDKDKEAGSSGSSQVAGATNTTLPPEVPYNTLQHGKDKEAGSGGSSQAAGAINTTPPPGGFYNTLEHDKDKEGGGPSGSEVYMYASVGRQG